MKLNAEWHRENILPERASLDQRVEWHIAHAQACGCREIPASVRQELERKGRKAPVVSSAA